VVVFHSLDKEHIRKIVDLMLATVSQQLAEKEIKLEVTDAAKDFLGEKGYDEVFGARPLRRVIQDMLENKLSDDLLRGEFKVFERVFEIQVQITEITSDIIDSIKRIKGVLNVDKSEDLLIVSCAEDLRPPIEKAIVDNKGLLVRMKMQSYISSVKVDVEAGEIVLKSEGEIVVHPAPIEAVSGRE
jgi:hypothetical protein